jgi:hypothetical protein
MVFEGGNIKIFWNDMVKEKVIVPTKGVGLYAKCGA